MLMADAFSAGSTQKNYSLYEHGYLALKSPTPWKDSVNRPPDNLPPTIQFQAGNGKPFAVLLTPIWPFNDTPPMTTEVLRKNVEKTAAQLKSQAVEKEIQLKSIKGIEGSGYYFKITDRAPKPDEFKYLTQGMIKVRDLVVTFTVLTNDGQDSVIDSALEVIKSIRNVRPASSIEKQGSVYRIAVPSTELFLEFPMKDLKLEQADDFRPYYHLTNSKLGLNVSFNFEHTSKCSNSKSCRDYFADELKAGYSNKKNWYLSQIGDVFVSENIDGPVNGFNLKQQHMNAHFVKKGVWIDTHLSKVQYKKTDREIFVNFIRSIRFRPKN